MVPTHMLTSKLDAVDEKKPIVEQSASPTPVDSPKPSTAPSEIQPGNLKDYSIIVALDQEIHLGLPRDPSPRPKEEPVHLPISLKRAAEEQGSREEGS